MKGPDMPPGIDPIAFDVTGGEVHEVKGLCGLMELHDADPDRLLGNNGYDSDAIREDAGSTCGPSQWSRRVGTNETGIRPRQAAALSGEWGPVFRTFCPEIGFRERRRGKSKRVRKLPNLAVATETSAKPSGSSLGAASIVRISGENVQKSVKTLERAAVAFAVT
jgi:hypothetical protein